MTKCVALEFAKQNIRVNTVSPAAIDTDMIDRFAGKEGAAREALIAKHPVGRLGKGEEIAAAVLYLCSDAAKVHHRNVAQGRWRLAGSVRVFGRVGTESGVVNHHTLSNVMTDSKYASFKALDPFLASESHRVRHTKAEVQAIRQGLARASDH